MYVYIKQRKIVLNVLTKNLNKKIFEEGTYSLQNEDFEILWVFVEAS